MKVVRVRAGGGSACLAGSQGVRGMVAAVVRPAVGRAFSWPAALATFGGCGEGLGEKSAAASRATPRPAPLPPPAARPCGPDQSRGGPATPPCSSSPGGGPGLDGGEVHKCKSRVGLHMTAGGAPPSGRWGLRALPLFSILSASAWNRT